VICGRYYHVIHRQSCVCMYMCVCVCVDGAVSARIAGFSTMYETQLHDTAVLPCVAVGKPNPRVTWKKRSVSPQPADDVLTLSV